MTGFNLSALAVRERAVTLFLIIGIAVAGAYAFLKLGRAEDPSFTIKVLTVTFALYALKAPGMAPRLLVRQAETIRQQLLHVPGVKKVNILGERPERIFVEFSYPRLVALGISAQDIFAALQHQNAVAPAGSIDTKGPQVFVRLDGAYDDLQKIADTPIVAGGGGPQPPPFSRGGGGGGGV